MFEKERRIGAEKTYFLEQSLNTLFFQRLPIIIISIIIIIVPGNLFFTNNGVSSQRWTDFIS